ncbi:MAG: chromosomal replication initiator protein DnaA [Candidatus Edwardsbacteria bacterium]
MEISAEKIWKDCLNRIKDRVHHQTFATWLERIKAVALKEDKLSVKVPNRFFIDWIGKHYQGLLQDALQEIMQKPMELEFLSVDDKPIPRSKGQRIVMETVAASSVKNGELRSRYTFESFVVGKSNHFAHAASMAVAEAPGKVYNPLFIYGGVGLGKTHLLQAVGNFIRTKRPKYKVYYVPAENFMNEMVSAIQHGTMTDFKSKYRSLDILLIDDVQFLTGKVGVQEEIFHTFNYLYDSQKQITFTSDRPPREISHLEERLVTRFQSGLVADIQIPDLETRVAILKRKADEEGMPIPNDVALYIAERIKSNIRELEGSLITLFASASIQEKEITLEFAQEILKDIFKGEKKFFSIETIQQVVAKFYGVSLESLKSKKRTEIVALPRQIAMYLARELTTASYPEIGTRFGGKDHTTILYAYQKIKEELKTNTELQQTLEKITKLIEG